AADGSRLRLPGGQRRGAAADAELAPALDAALHRAAQGASGLRPRLVQAAPRRQHADLLPHPDVGGGHRPLRAQPRALGAGRAARPLGVRRNGAGGDARSYGLPTDRGAALPPDARSTRILLVPAAAGGAGGMSMDEQALIEYVTRQRWYGAKSRTVTHSEVLDTVPIRQAEPQLTLALVELRYDTGAHDLYQLLFSGGADDAPFDGLAEDAGIAREMLSAMRTGVTLQGSEGVAEFRPSEDFSALGRELGAARLVSSEQSNSSVVFDDTLILKVFRHLEPGINPELEMLR